MTGWNLTGGTQGDTLGRTKPPENTALVFKATVNPAECWKQNVNGKTYFDASFSVSRGEHRGKGASENFYIPGSGDTPEKVDAKLKRVSWLVQAFLPGMDLTDFAPAQLAQINGREGVMYVEWETNEESGKTYANLLPIRAKDAQAALAGTYHPLMGYIPAPVTPTPGFSPSVPPQAAVPQPQAVPQGSPQGIPQAAPQVVPVAMPVAMQPQPQAAMPPGIPQAAMSPVNIVPQIPQIPVADNGQTTQAALPGFDGLFNTMP